ncbi:hypothetical protein MMC20_003501 [Loxospora ochrophaea]|nr:hypothetical protein [Loxospora ochrophaea]
MSSSTTDAPISPARFAAALTALPLSSLHAKAAELRNSIAHLQQSNQELQEYANDGDEVCAEAIRENEEVVERMSERIELLKEEVEGRGFMWEGGTKEDGNEERALDGTDRDGSFRATNGDNEDGHANGSGRRIGDEEMARRLRQMMEIDEENDQDGVHL